MSDKTSRLPPVVVMLFAFVVGAAGAIILGRDMSLSTLRDRGVAWGLVPGCNIKGNINVDTGERIYHLPGQDSYAETRIRPRHGERWFCTEEEAKLAGWRQARR